jgi:hypothetical protein
LLAGFDRIAFGADGENAQRARAKPLQHRHSSKECDVVFDRHDDPWLEHDLEKWIPVSRLREALPNCPPV